jgi:hypothetical protein
VVGDRANDGEPIVAEVCLAADDGDLARADAGERFDEREALFGRELVRTRASRA